VPYELIEFPFAAGLDEATDPRRTPKFLTVENYLWTKTGRLEKRPGYTTVSSVIAGTDQGLHVASITLTNGGTGYPATGIWLTTGGGGHGAAGLFAATAGVITTIGVNQPGFGYTSTPTIDFNPIGAGGTGATGTLTMAPSTPTNIADSVSIRQSPQGQLQVSDGTNIYTRTNKGWQSLGSIQNLNVTTSPFPLQIQAVDNISSTYPSALPLDPYLVQCAGYYVWTFGTAGVAARGWMVQDPTTGALVPTNNGVILGGGASDVTGDNSPSQVVSTGSYVFRFEGGGPMFFAFLDCGTAAVPQEILSGSGFFPDPITPTQISAQVFDCAWDSANNILFIAYVDPGNLEVVQLKTYRFDEELVRFVATLDVHATIDLGTGSAATAIGVFIGSGRYLVAVAYTNGSNTCVGSYVVVANTILAPATPIYQQDSANYVASVINIAITESSLQPSQEYHVIFTGTDWGRDQFNVVAAGPVNTVHVISVSGFFSPQTLQKTLKSTSTTLMTKPWLVNGAPHALCLANAGLAYVVLNLDAANGDAVTTIGNPDLTRATPTPIALINPRVAMQGLGTNKDLIASVRGAGTLASPISLGNNRFLVPTTQAPEPGESALLTMQSCTLQYGTPLTPPAAEWTSMFYPASIPSVVGSGTVRAAQFLTPPVIVAHTTQSTGVNPGLDTGNYIYVATYMRVNDDGSITESAPSAPLTLNIGAAHLAAKIYVSSYPFAGRGQANSALSNTTYVVLYHSLVDQTTLHRLAQDPFTIFEVSGAAENDTSAPTLLIIDSAPNTGTGGIDANPVLYIEGGVFSNVSPPACTLAARVRDRVWLAGTPDGYTVFYSDTVANAGTANFHDEQTLTTDDDGPITAIAQLEANVVLFKEDALYAVFGTEGGNTGNGNTLSAPTSIPTGGIGCISSASVVETPQGLMFQSRRGIELIDRAFQLTFIGASVKDETAGQTVTAAVLVPAQYQIRFFLQSGKVLVFSTLNSEWTTYSYANLPLTNVRDATNVNGIVYWCGDGHILQETPGAYSDNGSVITARFKSGWIGLGQLAGYHRIHSAQLLGTYFGKTQISISIANDFSTAPYQTEVFTDAQILAIPGFDANRLLLDIMAASQRSEAVQISVVDSGPIDLSFNQGIGWDAYAFEYRTLPGAYRNLPPAATR